MTTYYVRKTGLDANGGTTPGAAWLTIDKAANTVAAGDIVYVGAGTYRELVTMDTAGSSGSPIQYIADVTGEQTGDAGLVVISAFTDSNTAARGSCWDPNDGKAFIEVYDFVFQGGTSACVYDPTTTNNTYEGVLFDGCVFNAAPAGDQCVSLDYNEGATPTTTGLTIRDCVFVCADNAGLFMQWNGNATAERDMKVTIENCVFVGASTTTPLAAIGWDMTVSDTFGLGGVTITNCLFYTYYGVYVDDVASTTYPVDVRNCVGKCQSFLYKQTTNDGALTSGYNTFIGSLTNVTAGTNDRNETSALMLGGLDDMPLLRKWGWSPYRPWEPMRPPSDDDWSSVIGDANPTDAPATDLYGDSRPMHGTADDRGPVEGRARLEPETTTVRTGTTAGRFDGAGVHRFTIPVAAASTTVAVYCRKDGTYAGTAPQLKVSRIPGVADQTDTHTAAANTWEELTVTFTPTSAGVAVVELISNDTSAGGECFFDDFTVT